ncbi:MAG TPA: putative lipopolysaccharide heptosyltransferase III [Nitrospirota bacterium]|nr:putative lipopolysaccharide heptosyltransferase III [Nitrospirota bacterium]
MEGAIDISGIRSVLVIKLRHIGDVLLATPTLRALKEATGARITAVTPAGMEEMLTLNPSVDEVLPLVRGRGLIYDMKFIARLRDRKFDLAINMTEGDRGAVISFLSGARWRIGIDPGGKGFFGKRFLFTHLVRPPRGVHRAVADMEVLAPLGIKPRDPVVELFVSPDDEAYVGRVLEEKGVPENSPVAVVHPTSRWLFKCWEDGSVASVIEYIEGRGVRVAVTSGPDGKEVEKAKKIISLCRTNPLDMTGALTLKRLAALLKRSTLFFGVDTAPMHMAAAVGTPVVALFGPSDHRVWRPFGKKTVTVVKEKEFPCLPCGKDGCGGTKKSRCIEAITVDDAVAAVEELIGAGTR